jgi:hypothetical protein
MGRWSNLGTLAALAAIEVLSCRTESRAELSPDIKRALASSSQIWIATTRKDGNLGTRSESWFLYHNGLVYIASSLNEWRVRRIKAGRPRAKIWVGAPDGPSFMATGAIVRDPQIPEVMFKTYAKKYPSTDKLEMMWPDREPEYRKGLKDGSRVLVKYTPTD